MTTNPYQAPDSVPDGPANVDYGSLSLTLPRPSRLERVYRILLSLWAAGMAVLSLRSLCHSHAWALSDWICTVYFVVLALMSVGVWRGSRLAEVIAIVQLAVVWLFAVLVILTVAGVLSFRSPFLTVMFCVTFFSFFVLPTSALLILAWFVSRQRSV